MRRRPRNFPYARGGNYDYDVTAPLLQIEGLTANAENLEILRGIDLTINHGEIHAIMGPNGSGKSTLANVLAGHPQYRVTGGSILFQRRRSACYAT